MSLYYLDTSALVKLYVREPGTEAMLLLAGRAAGHTLVILSLTRVEFRSAVRRRQRAGDVPPAAAEELITRMDRHLQDRYTTQPVTEAVMEEASGLLDRHALRAYDALQLAGCLTLRSKVTERPSFVCADRQLLEAAVQEGLAVLDVAIADSP